MDGFNINNFLMHLQNSNFLLRRLKNSENILSNFNSELSHTEESHTEKSKHIYSKNIIKNNPNTNTKTSGHTVSQNIQNLTNTTKQLQMNSFANTDRSVFIKNLLGLPQNLSDVLFNVQQQKPVMLMLPTLNMLNPQNSQALNTLANIAQETHINSEEIAQDLINKLTETNNQNKQLLPKDSTSLLFNGMVNLKNISELITLNGKNAAAFIIISMASASKSGISNTELHQTLSVLNSCLSMAESDNPTQSLKSLMMLYLPWLPLNEGVGFDLEITPQDGENDSNDSQLTVLIQTKNFGNLKGIFTLTTSNSVEILIICSENFPKNLLQKSLAEESSSHSMNTNIEIDPLPPQQNEENEVHETKVNLSATNELNPYLLLMAHAFIRNTILIDNNASLMSK